MPNSGGRLTCVWLNEPLLEYDVLEAEELLPAGEGHHDNDGDGHDKDGEGHHENNSDEGEHSESHGHHGNDSDEGHREG